jgi:hypothetical protein
MSSALAASIAAGQRRTESQTGDVLTVLRHDQALRAVDVRWESGPEKGQVASYLEGWIYARTTILEDKS